MPLSFLFNTGNVFVMIYGTSVLELQCCVFQNSSICSKWFEMFPNQNFTLKTNIDFWPL